VAQRWTGAIAFFYGLARTIGALSATAPHGITHVPGRPQSLYQQAGAVGAADWIAPTLQN
jgi:hypothetical protein